MFNTTPVLVRHLPPKMDERTQTLVGPKPRSKPTNALPPLTDDPWGNWKGPRLSPTSSAPAVPAQQRQVDGPTQTRLTAQDQKIDALQHKLQLFESQVQKGHQQLEERIELVKTATQETSAFVNTAVKDLRSDVDAALQKTLKQPT